MVGESSVCVESVVSFFFSSRTSATSRGVVFPEPSLEFILNMAHASFVDVTNVVVEIRMIVISIFFLSSLVTYTSFLVWNYEIVVVVVVVATTSVKKMVAST